MLRGLVYSVGSYRPCQIRCGSLCDLYRVMSFGAVMASSSISGAILSIHHETELSRLSKVLDSSGTCSLNQPHHNAEPFLDEGTPGETRAATHGSAP